MYVLAMTIDHCYWEHNYKCHYVKQVEKEALESHSQKQGKASTSGLIAAFSNKANSSLVVSSTKTFSKLSPSPTHKKQPNTLWVDVIRRVCGQTSSRVRVRTDIG